jgi:hypothetical protein
MSIRDAARIAALEARVSDLSARLEALEQSAAAAREIAIDKTRAASPRRGKS